MIVIAIDSSLGVGSVIGAYRLVELIGRGGMAVVFRAIDERLGRQVAVKVLAPVLAADEAFRQRFIRESRAAAAVDDPHIIPVFEAGESDGALFIAMRYVGGGDVRSLVASRGALTPTRAAAILSPVASALDTAHAAGLIHRDVKPANMLLDVRADRPDHVYLTDFGLSKGALSSIGLTGTGLFLGTPDYVSPEQIAGRELDGRTDQYSLACTAFELLGGRPPFQRDHPIAVIYAHTSEAPPKLTGSRAELPPAVDAVMAKALAKSPDDRYPNCQEFAGSLRQALGLPPYHVEPPGWPEQPPLDGEERPATPLSAQDSGGTTVRVVSMPGQTSVDSEPSREQRPPGRARRKAAIIGLSIALLVGAAAGGIILRLHAGSGAHTRANGNTSIKPFTPIPGSLHGVAAASATSAWAVGQYCVSACFQTAAVMRAMILHWNGHGWSSVPSPHPGGSSFLRAITTGRGSTALAVGGFCASSCGTAFAEDHPLILRWNGKAWSTVVTPTPSSSSWLRAVTVASNGQAWAVGAVQTSFPGTASYAIDPLILHWDGSRWTQFASPINGSNASLDGVTIDPQGGAWAVGHSCVSACLTHYETDRPLILHWNGKHWLSVHTGNPSGDSSLLSVSVGRTESVWAVGSTCVASCFAGSQIYRSLIMHWDGGVWSQVPSPSAGSSAWLYAVSTSPGGHALAVGDTCVSGCYTTSETDRGLVLKWDGRAWAAVPNLSYPTKHPIFYNLNAGQAGFVVGRFCVSNCFTLSERYRTLLLRWNGTALVKA